MYELRDALCANWCRRGNGAHHWHTGYGRAGESGQIDRLALSGPRDFHPVDLRAGDLDRTDSVMAIRQSSPRTRGARFRDYEQRIGVAKSDGIDGAFRRAAA